MAADLLTGLMAILQWEVLGFLAVGVLLGLGEIFWYGGNVIGAITAANRFNKIQVKNFYTDLEQKYFPVADSEASLTIPIFAMRF